MMDDVGDNFSCESHLRHLSFYYSWDQPSGLSFKYSSGAAARPSQDPPTCSGSIFLGPQTIFKASSIITQLFNPCLRVLQFSSSHLMNYFGIHSSIYYLLVFGGLWVRSHHHCFASLFMLFTHIRISLLEVSLGLPGLQMLGFINVCEDVSLLRGESAARNSCSGNPWVPSYRAV